MNDEMRQAYAEVLQDIDVQNEQSRPTVNDYKQAFESANEQLKDIDRQLHPRGSNLGGGFRNLMQGLLLDAWDEIEAVARAGGKSLISDKSYSDLYDTYLRNTRESEKGFAKTYPGRAVSLRIGGAALPAVATAIATGGSGSGASASWLANAARMGLTGAGIGALAGFNAGEGGLSDRLLQAAGSGAIGGATGAALPIAKAGLSNVGNFAKNMRYANVSLTPNEIEQGLLSVTANPKTVKDVERALSKSVKYGNDDISYGARNLGQRFANVEQEIKSHSDGLFRSKDPELFEAIRTPEMDAASQAYSDFMAANKDLPLPKTFYKDYAKPGSIVRKIDSRYDSKIMQDMLAEEGIEPGTFGAAQKVKSLLGKTERDLQGTSDSIGASQARFEKSRLSNAMEDLAPGLKELDKEYNIALKNQAEQVSSRIKSLAKIANVPQDSFNVIDPVGAAVATGGAVAGSPGMTAGASANVIARALLGRANRGFGNRILKEGFENAKTYRLPTTGISRVDEYLKTKPLLESLIRTNNYMLPMIGAIEEHNKD